MRRQNKTKRDPRATGERQSRAPLTISYVVGEHHTKASGVPFQDALESAPILLRVVPLKLQDLQSGDNRETSLWPLGLPGLVSKSKRRNHAGVYKWNRTVSGHQEQLVGDHHC
jgi:hypothetical protein